LRLRVVFQLGRRFAWMRIVIGAHLLPAAVALFAEQGYERTTAAQIGERP
jgi:AcrR family transcriptional regulator